MTWEDIRPIIQRHYDAWHDDPSRPWLAFLRVAPGEYIRVFDRVEQMPETAGMAWPLDTRPRRTYLIAVNRGMLHESQIATFFHEYGHAEYDLAHSLPDGGRLPTWDVIESEVAAIRCSLRMLEAEGLQTLAYSEAGNIQNMADTQGDPYRAALARLAGDPLWQRYAPDEHGPD